MSFGRKSYFPGTVTRCALSWRGLVEEHILAFHHPHELMTRLTAHVLMGTLQRESGSLLVIEQRRLPLGTVVTFNT